MATLADIFGNIKENCYMDDTGVYLNGEKVAIDNTRNSAYTRRNGARSMEKIGNGVYRVEQEMRLVAAAPGADPNEFERAVINALDRCNYTVTASDTDKQAIADAELIEREQLTKFVNVAMVAVDFISVTVELNDVNCDVSLC